MKRESLFLSLFFFVFASHAQNNSYQWKEVIPPGNGSFEERWTPDKWPMGILPLVAFNNHLYMIGQKTTWISTDGINWTAHPKTDWGERHGVTFTFFDGKIWMMGGMKTWDKFYNDVWSSTDGKEANKTSCRMAGKKRA